MQFSLRHLFGLILVAACLFAVARWSGLVAVLLVIDSVLLLATITQIRRGRRDHDRLAALPVATGRGHLGCLIVAASFSSALLIFFLFCTVLVSYQAVRGF